MSERDAPPPRTSGMPACEPWTPTHGYPGPAGVLRVWSRGDGSLADAIIATHWRARCEQLGISLEDAFGFAFVLVRNDHELVPPMPSRMAPSAAAPPLDRTGTWASFVVENDAAAAPLLAKLRTVAGAPTSVAVGGVISTGQGEGQLTVDAGRRPLAVNFSDGFLRAATTSQIRDAVRSLASGQHLCPTQQRMGEGELLLSALCDITDQLTSRLVWELPRTPRQATMHDDDVAVAALEYQAALHRAERTDRGGLTELQSHHLWRSSGVQPVATSRFEAIATSLRAASNDIAGRTQLLPAMDRRAAELVARVLRRSAIAVDAVCGAPVPRIDAVTARMTMALEFTRHAAQFVDDIEKVVGSLSAATCC